jgi:hypothetical protein
MLLQRQFHPMDEDNDKIGVLWLNPTQYQGFSTPLFFPESVPYLSRRAFYDFPITASTALARATGHLGDTWGDG